jgi:tRNA pseudouridine38-40 synthase
LPFIARYGWYWRRTFDIEKFRTALQQFVGTHDFKLFCSAEEQRENTVRTIDAIDVRYIARFKVYRVVITGYAFLHHMIRRIVGTAMRIASHVQYQVHHINMMLNNGTIGALPVFNAPAHGLLLYAITYNTNEVCS